MISCENYWKEYYNFDLLTQEQKLFLKAFAGSHKRARYLRYKKLYKEYQYETTDALADFLRTHPNFDVNFKDINGDTPLHHACFLDDLAGAKLLIQHGADINAEDNEKRTPLNCCVRLTGIKVFRLLMKHHPQIDRKDIKKQTPLHYAIQAGNLEMIETLLNNKADVNAKVGYVSPIHFVFLWNIDRPKRISILKLLLPHRPKINAKNAFGETPLLMAVRDYDEESMLLLLSAGADPTIADKDNETPLSVIAQKIKESSLKMENWNDDREKLVCSQLHLSRYTPMANFNKEKERYEKLLRMQEALKQAEERFLAQKENSKNLKKLSTLAQVGSNDSQDKTAKTSIVKGKSSVLQKRAVNNSNQKS